MPKMQQELPKMPKMQLNTTEDASLLYLAQCGAKEFATTVATSDATEPSRKVKTVTRKSGTVSA
jgi:hypothetical protein